MSLGTIVTALVIFVAVLVYLWRHEAAMAKQRVDLEVINALLLRVTTLEGRVAALEATVRSLRKHNETLVDDNEKLLDEISDGRVVPGEVKIPRRSGSSGTTHAAVGAR
jgi:hypothetical protein